MGYSDRIKMTKYKVVIAVGVLVTVAPFSHKLCYPETVST